MSTLDYGNPNYWQKRYSQDPNPFDWYIKLSEFETFVSEHLHNEKKVLVIGCGTSSNLQPN